MNTNINLNNAIDLFLSREYKKMTNCEIFVKCIADSETKNKVIEIIDQLGDAYVDIPLSTKDKSEIYDFFIGKI